MQRTLLLLLAITTIACNGPTLLLPGGPLDGETRPVPEDWSFAGDYGTAQIETRPEDPYSVNIAYTILNGSVYINAGDTETAWVKNLTADPRIRLRIDGALYDMQVERVSDADEIAAFGKAWTDQSTFRRDPTELEHVWVYRLAAR